MSLQPYHHKRDFTQTTEPKGEVSKATRQRFVVQEHHATQLHYDFRLEMGGVLKSWAVPKGPSLDPRQKRLAVMVEDHPVDYIDYEGYIAEGNYGAGEVRIWDRGNYELVTEQDPLVQVEKGKLTFRLKGKKLQGEFSLVHMHKRDQQWLLIKSKDEFADSDWVLEPILPGNGKRPRQRKTRTRAKASRSKAEDSPARRPTASPAQTQTAAFSEVPRAQTEPMPERIDPMLATLVNEPFSDPDWVYESKWDGVRALCFISDGEMRLVSRNQKEISFRYPELTGLVESITARKAILDGEIVVLNENGQPNFQQLQARLGLQNKADIERLAAAHPVVYYVFDLLYFDRFNLMPGALIRRKALLQKILQPGQHLRYSEYVERAGDKAYAAAAAKGLEGVIAKHRNSPYEQGRSSHWLKIKTVLQQEVVIGGYTEPRGARQFFGALVVGLYRDEKLHAVGHVGGGFNRESLEQVYELMQPLRTKHSPFVDEPPTNEPVQWVKPQWVAQVKFAEWTAGEQMRQPIFLGLRDDKQPHECTFERKQEVTREVKKAEAEVSRIRASSSGPAVPASRFFRARKLHGEARVKVGPHVVSFTHLDKVYWPDAGYTKADLIRYYHQVSKYMLPYLEGRPLILVRYPNGIEQPSFIQHNVDEVPDFVRTFSMPVEEGHVVDYVVCDNEATLLYLANLGTIAQNPWHSRVDDRDHPDWIVFDLDPDEEDFELACELALAFKEVLDELGLKGGVKTSGSTGLHVYLPIEPIYDYTQVARLAKRVATLVQKAHPKIATLERSKKKRPAGQVYLDHLQNARGKSVVAPYSVRARPGATVSTPLEWKELNRKLSPQDFHIKNIPQRLAKKGDLFKGVLRQKQNLDDALKKL